MRVGERPLSGTRLGLSLRAGATGSESWELRAVEAAGSVAWRTRRLGGSGIGTLGGWAPIGGALGMRGMMGTGRLDWGPDAVFVSGRCLGWGKEVTFGGLLRPAAKVRQSLSGLSGSQAQKWEPSSSSWLKVRFGAWVVGVT